MARKKWTPQTEVNESTLQFREKRKWQIALRRYVLEKNKSSFYAPYFGVSIEKFREWIELQFSEELSWENFSDAWQFDHVVPVAYFDFSNEADLRLCWNFTNIRVEKVDRNKAGNRMDVLAAKKYFAVLFQNTGYSVCRQMLEKITRIEVSQIASNTALESFIQQNKDFLESAQDFSPEDFDRLNAGMDYKSLLYEKEFLKKYGG